eukprot:4107466-Pyramimonas_sp.AAC.1
MFSPHTVQRYVAPEGAPPKAPVAQFACVRGPRRSSTQGPSGAGRMRPPAQYSVSRPQRELHRRP